MKSPLSFNAIDYRRAVVIVGKIPNVNYNGASSVHELWKRETSNTDSLKMNFKFDNWTFQKDEVFNNLNHDFDAFVDQEISTYMERQNDIYHVIGINDLSKWSENGVINYLFAEARPKKLILVAQINKLSEIAKPVLDGMFGNCGCLIIGSADDDDRNLLKPVNNIIDNKLWEKVINFDKNHWAMYFPMAFEGGRCGLYLYNENKLIQHVTTDKQLVR